jgi:diaminopimelate decarboxylase
MVSTSPVPASTADSRQYLPPANSAQALSPNQQLLPLTATVTPDDHLSVGGCDVVDLAERFGTPLYILDDYTLRTACRQYRQGLSATTPARRWCSTPLRPGAVWRCAPSSPTRGWASTWYRRENW